MKKENKNMKFAALASSAVVIGAFGVNTVNASELLQFEDLGTGSELRANLITADAFTSNTDVEFECGEGKCGEGKCGEGKCGEDEKKDDKKAETKDEKSTMTPVQGEDKEEADTKDDSKSKTTKVTPQVAPK